MTWAKGKQLSTMTKGEQTLSFKYDANGIRTKKTVNNVEYEYTYVGDKLVRVESNKPYDDPLTIYYTADGKPHSFIYGGGPFYYMLNLQGDVIGIATGNGNVIVEYAYDSWGKPISVTVNNSIYEDVALANPLRYRGYVYDNETGLYYLQSRYYDPTWGRFINGDVYVHTGSTILGGNMYAYCYNNPVVYIDSLGQLPVYIRRNIAKIINIEIDFAFSKTKQKYSWIYSANLSFRLPGLIPKFTFYNFSFEFDLSVYSKNSDNGVVIHLERFNNAMKYEDAKKYWQEIVSKGGLEKISTAVQYTYWHYFGIDILQKGRTEEGIIFEIIFHIYMYYFNVNNDAYADESRSKKTEIDTNSNGKAFEIGLLDFVLMQSMKNSVINDKENPICTTAIKAADWLF